MKIELTPTPDFETFKGVDFRIYEGEADGGIRLQMIGMFRVADVAQRAKFAEEVCKIAYDKPFTRTPLIMTPNVVVDAPPESAKKIALLRRALALARERLGAYRRAEDDGMVLAPMNGPDHNHVMDQIEEALR